jgi:STE24 endopeptidase
MSADIKATRPEAAIGTLETTLPEVKRYQRLKLTASVASLFISLGFLAIMALWLGPALNNEIARLVGHHSWLRLMALAAVYAVATELLILPTDFWSGYVLEHQYDLSNQTLKQWLWRQLKGYVLGAILGAVLVAGLYFLLWHAGWTWWIWATAGWLGLVLLLGQLVPVLILPLFYRVTRLDDPPLFQGLAALAADTGLRVEGIYRLHLSAETKKANAALAGLGRTRRVLLGDTLLDQFSHDEIAVVFAHEVGHHVYHHLPKMIIGNVVLAAAGFWLVDMVLRHAAQALGYPAYDDPAALPLVFLVLMAFGLLFLPLQNAISRRFERQCDRYALKRTGKKDAYRSAFIKLARMNKADVDPNPLVVWLFEDHPPIRERLAMAEASGA